MVILILVAMFHAYARGGSYPHQVYSTSRWFYYQFCGCNESCWGWNVFATILVLFLFLMIMCLTISQNHFKIPMMFCPSFGVQILFNL
jgi:hypothetical protein